MVGLTCGALIIPWVILGAMNEPAFDIYVETRLVRVLASGTVVILDNLSNHRSPHDAATLRAKGCQFLLLPPNTPHLNPIEKAFSKLEAHPRRMEARSFERMLEALASICRLFTPAECENYLRAAGYAKD